MAFKEKGICWKEAIQAKASNCQFLIKRIYGRLMDDFKALAPKKIKNPKDDKPKITIRNAREPAPLQP